MVKDEIVKVLREYFEKDDKVIFAYLFGFIRKRKC